MSKKIFQYLSAIFFGILIIQMLPSLIKTIKEDYLSLAEPKTKVGLICITDMIKETDKPLKNIKKYFEDKSIKAILLKIDSQGGYAGSSEAIFLEIMSLKKEFPKPVISLTENICASGGYLIACAADYIIATPSATVGSIGSYIGYFKVKELMDQYKVKFEIQKSGKYKAMGNPFTDINQEEIELLQEFSNDCYNLFLNNVSQRRNLSLKEKDKWAEGKIFTGSQALKLGLVDEVGSRFNAVKKIKELAVIDGKIDWVTPKKENWLEKLTSSDEDCSMNKILENSITNILTKKFVIN